MTALPAPGTDLRLLVGAADSDDAWPQLRAAAFEFGALEVECAGRRIFVFEQPLAALRFCLSVTSTHALPIAIDLDRIELTATPDAWRNAGAPRWLARSPGVALLDRLLADPAPAPLRFSPAAAALVQRAAVGSDLASLAWLNLSMDAAEQDGRAAWYSPTFDAGNAVASQRASTPSAATPSGELALGQPLPDRPHWWLTSGPRALGPLSGWRLRQQKTGQPGHAWAGSSDAAQQLLRARLDAERRLAAAGLAAPLLPSTDSRLQTPPYFIASAWLGVEPLLDWWPRQPDPLPLLIPALARLAHGLAAAATQGCAHGALHDDDLFVAGTADGPQLRIDGLRACADAERDAAGARDLQMLADLLFRLALGGPSEQPGPFWEGRIANALLRELLRACLDPLHPAPISRMDALADRLLSVAETATPPPALHAPRRWWMRERT
jgi:hypothetical protein